MFRQMNKNVFTIAFALFVLFIQCVSCEGRSSTCNVEAGSGECVNKKLLRHVVLFGFEDTATSDEVKAIEEKFAALPKEIPFIKAYEWGLDCSPEGLQKGHTHCFLVTFESEADRDAYLVHPAHKELGKMLSGKLKNVTVIDYWIE